MCVLHRIFNIAFVDQAHSSFNQGVITDAVLSHLDIVCRVPDEEMCCIGEENRRYCREAVTDGKKINVVLAARGQHTADHRMRSVRNIRFAVVEYQKAVFE